MRRAESVSDAGMKSGAPPRPVRPALLLACVLVAVLLSYIPVLGGPFIWDDNRLVGESALVKELHPLTDYFSEGFWQADELQSSRSYYRPLAILSLAIDEKLYDDNPGGFHFTNLLLHVLSTGLLFRLLRERGAAPPAAGLGSALWGLYPRLTEAVAWISGRTDVLAALFVLCALLAQRRTSYLARALTALFLLLGLLSKEVALAGVAFVLVAELAAKVSWRERLLRWVPAACALLLYGALRLHAVGLDGQTAAELSPTARLAACAATLGHYAAMFLSPWFPNIQIGRLDQPTPLYIALGCAAILALPFGVRRALRKPTPEALSALTLALCALFLVLHLVPLPLNVLAADRFLYLPLLGVTLWLTPVLAERLNPRWAGPLASALAVSFAAVTFVRAGVWSDEVELWTTAVRETANDSSVPSVELGRLYARAGLFSEALVVDAHAARVNDAASSVALNNTANVLNRSGRYAEAATVLTTLTRRYPSVPLFTLNLALSESYLGDFEPAQHHLLRALSVYPDYAQGQALVQRLPELERKRHELDALPANAPLAQRARLSQDLGLAHEALQAWRGALQAADFPRGDLESVLWFALREGDAASVGDLYEAYRTRYPSARDPRLDLVYEARVDLVKRLRKAWKKLGLAAPEG